MQKEEYSLTRVMNSPLMGCYLIWMNLDEFGCKACRCLTIIVSFLTFKSLSHSALRAFTVMFLSCFCLDNSRVCTSVIRRFKARDEDVTFKLIFRYFPKLEFLAFTSNVDCESYTVIQLAIRYFSTVESDVKMSLLNTENFD